MNRNEAILTKVALAGGSVLSEVELRGWGEAVGYALDPDGHVLAVARL